MTSLSDLVLILVVLTNLIVVGIGDVRLCIRVVAARPLMEIAHSYTDRHVLLDVWRVVAYAGTPTAREGQELKWVAAGDLREQDLLEADLPIVEALSA